VTTIASPIETVWHLLKPVFGLVLIDGDHSEAGCRRDLEIATALLIDGGIIAVHDYGRTADNLAGVTRAVDSFRKPVRVVVSLAIIV